MGFCGFVPGDENGGGDDGKVEDHPCPLRVVDQEQSQEVEEDDGPLTVFLQKIVNFKQIILQHRIIENLLTFMK